MGFDVRGAVCLAGDLLISSETEMSQTLAINVFCRVWLC